MNQALITLEFLVTVKDRRRRRRLQRAACNMVRTSDMPWTSLVTLNSLMSNLGLAICCELVRHCR